MTKIRALVVEDSVTVRRYLVDVLRASSELEVVAEAQDGKQAIELCERLRPDVVTLDMMLPSLSGLAATEYIMAFCPTPIVIVSGSTNRGEVFKTYEALAAGAVDVLEKPLGDTFDGRWERRFVETVKLVSRVKVITHPRARLRAATRDCVRPVACPPREPNRAYRCVAICVSTGGPQALATLLHQLPADFPLPLLIVMHISPGFGEAFASWLNDQSPIPVSAAIDGEALPPCGTPRVVLAPPDHHLIVRGGRLRLTRDPEVHSCRPAVDLLFQSVAHEIGEGAIAVLLTGMGRDGARGLLTVRNAGGMTLAQDEATSVVFGMPREAIQIGAAERVLPLDEVAPTLVSLATASQQTRDEHETASSDRRRQPHGPHGS
jgi:two-component system chemotaxis response regulator CheB